MELFLDVSELIELLDTRRRKQQKKNAEKLPKSPRNN